MISKVTEQELDDALKNALKKAEGIDQELENIYEAIMAELSRIIRLSDNSRKNSDPLGAYPDGVTIMRVNMKNLGFPHDFGALITHKAGSYGFQYYSNNIEREKAHPVISMRSWMPAVTSWTSWDRPETSDGAQHKVDEHRLDKNNPHSVTKTQVSLGSVQNFGIATKAEAVQGESNVKYMTPLRTKEAIEKIEEAISALESDATSDKNSVDAHIGDKDNPHSVTKAQVSLGSVQNFGIATKAEAVQGESNAKYMTPLRTKEAIEEAQKDVDNHKNDKNNPHSVTKEQVGLGSVQNYSIASTTEAKSGTANTKYMTPLRTKEAMEEISSAVGETKEELTAHINDRNNPHNTTAGQVGAHTKKEVNDAIGVVQGQIDQMKVTSPSIPAGLKGYGLFLSKDNANEIEVDATVKRASIVRTDLELASAQQNFMSNREVFDSWQRFSHGPNRDSQPGVASELTGWLYNEANDLVVSTINSTSHIGFYSEKVYNNYLHEVTLTSDNTDDDVIGVLIAAANDSSGRLCTLTILRNNAPTQGHTFVGGKTFQWAIVYNYKMTDERIVADGTSALQSTGTTPWRNAPNGVRVKVRRDGDTVEVDGSELNETSYRGALSLSVNLSADADLLKFRGPRPYGYTCFSQPASTFRDIYFSDSENTIYDARDKSVWTANAQGVYAIDPQKKIDEIGSGRILENPATGNLFHLSGSGDISTVGKVSMRVEMSVSSGGHATLDVHDLFGDHVNAKDTLVNVTARDTMAGSPTTGMYINAEAVVTVGKDDRYIRIVNEYNQVLDLVVLVVR